MSTHSMQLLLHLHQSQGNQLLNGAEDDAQRFDVEEEVFTGRDPARVVEGEGATGEEAVEMEVAFELLIPGMEDKSKGWSFRGGGGEQSGRRRSGMTGN